ncbi:MAG: hypothetical protein M0C28_47290 [Candidatus Moduliflexus flocculans]|nr:hypothetical protein [Candidatus Moduliflexus flocculans]
MKRWNGAHCIRALQRPRSDEGFKDIAHLFRQVAKVEAYHERRYTRLLANLEKDEVFVKDLPRKWVLPELRLCLPREKQHP